MQILNLLLLMCVMLFVFMYSRQSCEYKESYKPLRFESFQDKANNVLKELHDQTGDTYFIIQILETSPFKALVHNASRNYTTIYPETNNENNTDDQISFAHPPKMKNVYFSDLNK